MMKQKRWHKFLIPLVVFIWVGVIFRYLDGCQPSAGESVIPQGKVVLLQEDFLPDSFVLSLDYEDPFLGGSWQAEKQSRRRQNTSSPAPRLRQIEDPRQLIVWPTLRYQGGVQRQSQSSMTGLLEIDGHVYPVQAGDSLLKLHILALDLQSIRISFADSIAQLDIHP